MKSILISLIITICSISVLSQIVQKDSVNQTGLEKLHWLAGYWTAEIDGTKMEELWLPESNNMMMGIHRDSFSSGKVFFEYLRIEESANNLTYIASPKGNKSTEFYLKLMNKQTVIFENPEHDFPQRIMYSLRKDILFVKIEGTVNGKQEYVEWKWHRSKI